MTLWRYVLRRFLKALAAVTAVILLLVLLFASVENMRRFGDSPAGLGDILEITLLQAPEVLYQVFPLVLMLASLVMFLGLARTSELVVLRAAGISALRLIAIPMCAAVALGLLFIGAVNPFVAATMQRGIEIEDEFSSSRSSRLSFSDDGLWLRQAGGAGQAVIQAGRANSDGSLLAEVRMHEFDDEGRLVARIEAVAARLADGEWVLTDATRWEAAPEGGFERVAEHMQLRVPTQLTTQQIVDSFSAPEMIAFWDLQRFIGQLENAGFSGLRHRLYLQSELAKPVLFAAMVLIGAAFALRPSRFGQTGVMILLAILAGFSLYFLKDFAESLGGSGAIPLIVAAWTPSVAAILLALGLILHLEDG